MKNPLALIVQIVACIFSAFCTGLVGMALITSNTRAFGSITPLFALGFLIAFIVCIVVAIKRMETLNASLNKTPKEWNY